MSVLVTFEWRRGIGLELAWNWPGICLELAWNLPGIGLELAWIAARWRSRGLPRCCCGTTKTVQVLIISRDWDQVINTIQISVRVCDDIKSDGYLRQSGRRGAGFYANEADLINGSISRFPMPGNEIANVIRNFSGAFKAATRSLKLKWRQTLPLMASHVSI